MGLSFGLFRTKKVSVLPLKASVKRLSITLYHIFLRIAYMCHSVLNKISQKSCYKVSLYNFYQTQSDILLVRTYCPVTKSNNYNTVRFNHTRLIYGHIYIYSSQIIIVLKYYSYVSCGEIYLHEHKANNIGFRDRISYNETPLADRYICIL